MHIIINLKILQLNQLNLITSSLTSRVDFCYYQTLKQLLLSVQR